MRSPFEVCKAFLVRATKIHMCFFGPAKGARSESCVCKISLLAAVLNHQNLPKFGMLENLACKPLIRFPGRTPIVRETVVECFDQRCLCTCLLACVLACTLLACAHTIICSHAASELISQLATPIRQPGSSASKPASQPVGPPRLSGPL